MSRLPSAVLAILTLVFAGSMLPCARADTLIDVVDVDSVWSGHPVGFSLLTHPPDQFVAYYDARRQMTIAQRPLDRSTWDRTQLASQLGWDSHNGVTMAIDRDGHLHVTGNMHCVPLVYFRSTRPLDAASLEQHAAMIGPQRERRVTYPVFLRGPEEQLIFRYRDGSSGSGDDIYNVYDETARQWRRLIDGPLVSGGGAMNAYCTRPAKGPDDRYHMVWVWRDTPDCATNHDLSYARSRDLVHWESAAGTSLALPITLDSPSIVDPIPPGGGLINGGHRLGFGPSGRPMIAYHKYDQTGQSQIFVARYGSSGWQVRQISRWENYRWAFSGGGSIPFEVRVGSVRAVGSDHMRVDSSSALGRHTWWLDATTLEPVSPPSLPRPEVIPRQPASAQREQSTPVRLATRPDFPGMLSRSAGDLGAGEDRSLAFRLRWFTLGPNRDRPRDATPPASLLQVGIYARD